MYTCQYTFEDHTVLTTDHELDIPEIWPFTRDHGRLMGYSDERNHVWYYEADGTVIQLA